MKVVILAGGLGTRLSEETLLKPKPMVMIGGKPIVWHIMKIYAHHGFNEFVICLGYMGYMIKEYFANYHLHSSNVTFDLGKNLMEIHSNLAEPWRVTLVDTGPNTMTGGRIMLARPYLGEQPFLLTYGDGVADVDITALVAAHRASGKLATVTAVQPTGRFGALNLDDENMVRSFQEKPDGDGAWINGGFFVFEPGVFDYLDDLAMPLEKNPLENLARDGQLVAHRHPGFWQPMDTMRDRSLLEHLWSQGNAPWQVWG